jgi:ATP-dependent Clp protease protease subunit
MEDMIQLNKTNQNEAELLIYGNISSSSWDSTAVGGLKLAGAINDLNVKKLKVRINSNGGEVKEGLAVYNLLTDLAEKGYEVETICDGFACSAASVIFMAGTKRTMNKASLLLIHNAWTFAIGDANELRKQADDIEKVTLPSIEIYKSVSNLSEKEIVKMMNEETWITADEALKWGFATEVKEREQQQSIDENYLYKQVMQNKRLTKEIDELKKSLEKKPQQKNGWEDFFRM